LKEISNLRDIWQEPLTADTSLAEIMAKARQRKPAEATKEPVAVVEVEQEIPPGEWPN
jgi:hypothetical protein